MGRAMTNNHFCRRGIGLLEVIVCTALVAVMIIPIAGVIRTSGQAISQSNGSTSTEASLRSGLRWLRDSVRDGTVVSVRPRRLQVLLSSGDLATVQVRSGDLVIDDGRSQFALAENVRDIRFREVRQVAPPAARTGVTMTLRARDPVTRAWVTVDSTVAIPPQA
jgi:hypothetical protein